MKIFLSFLLVFSLTSPAHADEGREFLMSCTYGVLTGALVGAASLAVEDEPDQKLHRIARGASLGLYTGLLLGLYVVYLLPSQMEKQNGTDPEDVPGSDEGEEGDGYDYDDGYEYQDVEDYGRLMTPPRMIIYPVFEQSRLTGAAVRLSLYTF